MPRENIRDRHGKLMGWFEDNGVSGRIDARDASGRWLGYYDKRLDETRDASGRLLAKGNLLASLIFRP
ncbi:hypothetical protein [Microvirga sp. 17 mud 1-3]|uniref:hypothetical protein n=1 Tax=Microvirga sp. 17 mud 1-3 TaxID=2082949 RepID=UPI000D6CF910|nr:hypothetical protein [Microvirga sp. 17 mud 1-3]AWM86800.1 hypothetical protein C4E04_08735 [Microvirga sp. 17 mud 1-3]